MNSGNIMEPYTIIVPDTDLLRQLCGTNDSNLKLIEEVLGLPVYVTGNELSIETENQEQINQFKFIVDRILDELEQNRLDGTNAASDEIIQSVLNTNDSRRFFELYSINVPGNVRKIYPRTLGQATLVELFRKNDMVFATGPAGSGKTFLAVAESLRLVLNHEKSTIILTRPVVEAGESLGFLPGDLEDKISPYLRPLYDSMNTVLPKDTVRRMTENGVIEIAPLAYMRGRTLNNCVIILDEAQNTTSEQMKMFLTRMGENSKVFITGDETQIDLPKRIQSGLVHAKKVLSGVEGIGFAELNSEDVVRNPLVKRIVQAYENEEQEN